MKKQKLTHEEMCEAWQKANMAPVDEKYYDCFTTQFSFVRYRILKAPVNAWFEEMIERYQEDEK